MWPYAPHIAAVGSPMRCCMRWNGLVGRERGLSFLTLEVRAGNAPAIALYEKNGYARVGRRPGYYDHPKEDAILMTYLIEQEKL